VTSNDFWHRTKYGGSHREALRPGVGQTLDVEREYQWPACLTSRLRGHVKSFSLRRLKAFFTWSAANRSGHPGKRAIWPKGPSVWPQPSEGLQLVPGKTDRVAIGHNPLTRPRPIGIREKRKLAVCRGDTGLQKHSPAPWTSIENRKAKARPPTGAYLAYILDRITDSQDQTL